MLVFVDFFKVKVIFGGSADVRKPDDLWQVGIMLGDELLDGFEEKVEERGWGIGWLDIAVLQDTDVG